MTSRKVLREISVPFLESQHDIHDRFTEEKVTMSPFHCQPPCSFSRHNECTASDDLKENQIPANSGSLAKEKSVYAKNATFSAGCNDPSVQSVGEKFESRFLAGMQQADNTTLCSDVREADFTTPKRGLAGSDVSGAESHTPVDFAKVTVADLGISPESFTSKCTGKSPKSLLKYKRRSTIGVRGSPEMNFLIRQIAQQRSKMSRAPDYASNPFISPRNSLLKREMSAFRDTFQAIDENEGDLPFPGSSDVKEFENVTGCQKSFGPPQKRKRFSHNVGFLTINGPKNPCTQTETIVEENDAVNACEKIFDSDCSVSMEPLTSLSLASELPCVSPSFHDEEVSKPYSPKRFKRKVMFIDPQSPKSTRSPQQFPENEDALVTIHCPKPCLRPVLKKTPSKDVVPTEVYGEEKRLYCTEDSSLGHDETLKLGFRGLACARDSVKKKMVTFGRELSPELFDKSLPANTPLRRGSTPYNRSTTDSKSPAKDKSVLYSPFKPLPQPDFDNVEPALQQLSVCFEDQEIGCDFTSSCSIPEPAYEMLLNEEARNVTEESMPVTLNLQIEHLPSPVSDETSTDSSVSVLLDVETPADFTVPTSKPDSMPNGGRLTRFTLKRKFCGSEESSANNTQTEDKCNISVKVEAKTVAKKAISRERVVAKKTQKKATSSKWKKGRGKPKKSVRKPQCEDREMISKKPLLSPIPELPECWPTPPASAKRGMSSVLQRKSALKRVQKVKAAQKGRGRVPEMKEISVLKEHRDNSVIMTLNEDGIDPLNSTLGKRQIIDINGVSPIPDTLSCSHAPSPTEQSPSHNTTAGVEPANHVFSQSREDDYFSVTQEPVVNQSHTSMVCVDAAIGISTENRLQKVRSAKSRRRSDRHSITYYSAQKHDSQDEILSEVDVSDTGLHTKQTSLCPKESTEDQCHKDREIPETPQQQMPVQDFPNEMMPSVSFAGQLSGRHVLVSEENNANNIAVENPPTMSPSVEQITASMEEPAPSNRKLENKVRRSMRLCKDSGANGLSWVHEETSREEKGKRRSVNFSMKRQVESPTLLCGNEIKSTVKESQANDGAISAGRKSRRRTICISTLRESPLME